MDAAAHHQWQQDLRFINKPMEEMLMAAAPANPIQDASAVQSGLSGAPPASDRVIPSMSQVPQAAAVQASSTAAPERRARPQKEKALTCPRCNSTNTKFCYYNNYSLTQPRYFCKACRRYWTEGGSLRNVPVGGGSRKNKRSGSGTVSASTSATSLNPLGTTVSTTAAKNTTTSKLAVHHQGEDLNLAYPGAHHNLHPSHSHHDFSSFPSLESSSIGNPSTVSVTAVVGGQNAVSRNANASMGAVSAMELLRSTGCYMPIPMPFTMQAEYATAAQGFGFGEYRSIAPSSGAQQAPTMLGFSLDTAHPHSGSGGDANSGYGNFHGSQQAGGSHGSRLLFPFEDLKPVVSSGARSSHELDHGKEQGGGADPPAAFWNGMMGGGGNGGSW